MNVEEVIQYWQGILNDNNIGVYDRVLVIVNDDVLVDLLPYISVYVERENACHIFIAMPEKRDIKEYPVIRFDIDFFDGLISLPSDHQLRERLIVCSYKENNIADLVCRYDIDEKRVEIKKEDIVAQGMLGLKETPYLDKQAYAENVYGKERQVFFETNKEYLPTRNTKYEPIELAKINIKKLIEKSIITPSKNVYIFGKTKLGQKLVEYLKVHNICVLGILDNLAERDETYGEIKVFNPNIIKEEESKSDIRIIIPLFSYVSACQQLLSYGLSFEKNIFVVTSQKKKEILDKNTMIQCSKKEISEARNCLNEIKNNCEKDIEIDICPYQGSGDVYLICSFLQQDKMKNGINHVLVVCSKALCRVASMLGILTVRRDFDEIINLAKWLPFLDATNSRVIDVNILTRVGSNLHGVNGLNYYYILHRMMFRELDIFYQPSILQTPNEEIVKKYKLDSGKTIIISPYATTMQGISIEVWEDIAKRLQCEGYDVYTNVVQEEPIKGTKPIFIPYESIIWCLNRCKAFIGIRSGLCDIVSTTKCKMLVFYKGRLRNKTDLYTLYSLKKMGIRQSNILEINFNENDNYVEALEWIMK